MLFSTYEREKVVKVWETQKCCISASRVLIACLVQVRKENRICKKSSKEYVINASLLEVFCYNVAHNSFTTLFVGTFTLIFYSNLMVSMLFLDLVPLLFIFREREFSSTINKSQRNPSGTRKFKATWS